MARETGSATKGALDGFFSSLRRGKGNGVSLFNVPRGGEHEGGSSSARARAGGGLAAGSGGGRVAWQHV
jgi:hypothetical protein